MAYHSENKKKIVPLALAVISVVAAVAIYSILGMRYALSSLPILIAIPASVYFLMNRKKGVVRPETILNEAPNVIGTMKLMIDAGHSLDSAVREVADNGPTAISREFRRITLDADTRTTSDISEGLEDYTASLSPSLSSFKRSLHLIISSSRSSDANERKRITKDANDFILAGFREMGERYGSKLNAPCMAIFGLGVMLPMIMISILPMLGIGGQMSSVVDPITIGIITLVVIPAVVAAVIFFISSSNPFTRSTVKKIHWEFFLPLTSLPIALALSFITDDVSIIISVSAIASSLLTFAMLRPRMAAEKKRMRTEASMRDVFFDLGNRLLSGENYENAVTGAFTSRKDSADLGKIIGRAIMLSRGDIEAVLHSSMDPYSGHIAELYCSVYRSSLSDTRESGRLAVSIGHQLQDQEAIMTKIGTKLSSMTDMMLGTAAIFAPLVLGISISMLSPLTKIVGTSGTGFNVPILMIYLVELAFLVSMLVSQLKHRGNAVNAMYLFSIIVPVSVCVFSLISKVSL